MPHVIDMSVLQRVSRPAQVDARLIIALRRVLFSGIALALLLPAAREYNAWLGWMPLWLVGMPLSALWAAHGFRLPQRSMPGRSVRRRRPQARRSRARASLRTLPRAA